MKRLLSLVVAFAMILSMVPNVFATETTEDQLPSDMETIGSLDNPEVLAELGSYSVTLASGDTDGYYYAYTAEGKGTVAASVDSVTAVVTDDNETEIVTASTEEESVTAAIVVTNTVTEESGSEVTVSEGDLVLIQVTSSAAATVAWYGSFTYYAGHETNPIWLSIGENTLTVAADATVYYCGRFGDMIMSAVGDGLTLEHNGTTYTLAAEAVEFTCVQASMWEPSTFVITNAGDTELTCTLTVSYPAGHQMNPEVTYLGWTEVSLAEGDYDGYYYTYTAEGTGTVTAYIGSITEGVEGDIVLYNNNTYVQKTLSADGVDNYGLEVTLDVNEGDVITIQVLALPDESYVYPAADITWVASFAYPSGSENNPIDLSAVWTWNEDYSEATATVTVPVGTTYYMSYGVGGMLLSVNGGEAVELVANPMLRGGAIFTLVNETEAEAEYTLTVSYPAGHQMNPEVTYLGWTEVSLAEGDYNGYYYTYTAEGTGTVTAYIGSITEGVEGDIVLYNNNTYVQKTLSADGVDNYGLEVTLDVNEGDVITIQVLALPDESYVYPAADITWVASFAYPSGSENNPIDLSAVWAWNEDYSEATATVTVPVGTTYYMSYGVGGMLLSVNGGEAVELVANPMLRGGAIFTLVNETEAEAEYTLTVSYPVGHQMNPEETWLGETSVSVAEGDYDGYYYTYTAEDAGTITAYISAITDGVEGDIVLYNNNTYVQKTLSADGVDNNGLEVTLNVNQGDVITIQVLALPDESYVYPAADITWIANFTAEKAAEPVVITQQPVDSNSVINNNAVFTVEVSNTEGTSYQWYLSTDDGATWAKCTYTGNKTNTLTIKVYASRVGWQVYCEVVDANGNVVNSDVAAITLKVADIEYVRTTTSGAVAVGKSWVANVTANATVENGTIAYRWFYSSDGGETWTAVSEDISGYNTNRLVITAYSTREGFLYRCRLTDADGAYIYSDPVELTLKANPLSVKTQATNAAVVLNTTATFTFEVDSSEEGTVSYKWFVSTDGGETWSVPTAYAGVNTSTLSVKAYASRDGFMFKCMASLNGHKLYSDVVTLTIKENPMSITENIESVTVAAGDTVNFHVAVEGNVGDVTYTWFTRKSSTGAWSQVAGETTDTLSFTATAAKNGYQYFCQVKDSEGNVVKTATATLTVE